MSSTIIYDIQLGFKQDLLESTGLCIKKPSMALYTKYCFDKYMKDGNITDALGCYEWMKENLPSSYYESDMIDQINEYESAIESEETYLYEPSSKEEVDQSNPFYKYPDLQIKEPNWIHKPI